MRPQKAMKVVATMWLKSEYHDEGGSVYFDESATPAQPLKRARTRSMSPGAPGYVRHIPSVRQEYTAATYSSIVCATQEAHADKQRFAALAGATLHRPDPTNSKRMQQLRSRSPSVESTSRSIRAAGAPLERDDRRGFYIHLAPHGPGIGIHDLEKMQAWATEEPAMAAARHVGVSERLVRTVNGAYATAGFVVPQTTSGVGRGGLRDSPGDVVSRYVSMMMMMSFICSCRNKKRFN